MQVQKKVKKIFESVGIYLDDNQLDEVLEIDSLQFVTIILEIETEFLIRLSNDFDDFSSLMSFNDFFRLVNSYFDGNWKKQNGD